jgi:hypothetical protein
LRNTYICAFELDSVPALLFASKMQYLWWKMSQTGGQSDRQSFQFIIGIFFEPGHSPHSHAHARKYGGLGHSNPGGERMAHATQPTELRDRI